MWDFLKKITGKKENKVDAMEAELAELNKEGFSAGKLLKEAKRNPQVMQMARELMDRMQKDGVDIKSGAQVKAWVAKNKETLMQEAQANAPAKVETVVRTGPEIGRNDPCHCGSGKKYKKCHLQKDSK